MTDRLTYGIKRDDTPAPHGGSSSRPQLSPSPLRTAIDAAVAVHNERIRSEGHGQDPAQDGAVALAPTGANAAEQASSEESPTRGPSHVAEVAYDFVRYYVAGTTGCRNCGGMPHSRECFVGRFVVALALDYNERTR